MSPLLHSEVVNIAGGICGGVVGYKSDVNKTVAAAAEERVCLHAISGRAVTRHPRVSDGGGSSGNCEITACLYLVVITAAL